jgi:hypothetical protein
MIKILLQYTKLAPPILSKLLLDCVSVCVAPELKLIISFPAVDV